MKYYIGVLIKTSGHATVTKPYADLNELLDEMRSYVNERREKLLATTYLVRETDKTEYTLQDVFGKPASRDFLRNRKLMKGN